MPALARPGVSTTPPVTLPKGFVQLCEMLEDDVAAELLTTDEARWPHLAHLSAGEVVIDISGGVRIALWGASQACANLASQGRAVLMAVSMDGVFEIRCEVAPLANLPGHDHLRPFRLHPVAVRDKSATYADIVSGTRFRLHDPVAAHARWRAVRALLQAAPLA